MYSANNKQYVFKQSSDRIYSFYYDNRMGICYSTLTKRNSWSESVSLQKKTHRQFYADIDISDNIHVLFQDLEGNIYVSIINNTSMKTIPLLNSKSPNAYNKNLSLLPMKNTSHFFYVLKHNENYILTHQTLSGETVSSPKALDYVPEHSMPYSAVYDESGTIYVFYQAASGVLSHIGYRKYVIQQRSWSEFIPITSHNSCECPKALIDTKDIIHICYQKNINNQYELVYQQKIPGKNIWTTETLIYRSQYRFQNASVCISSNTIIVFWVNDDIIYSSFSVNGGTTWSKPAKYSFNYGRQLLCIQYKSNNIADNSKFIAREIPGSFVNGLKLAFYPDNSTGAANFITSNEKNTIFHNLQTLKGDIDDIRDYKESINEKLHKNSIILQQLEKDLTKIQVKLSYLETEINNIKFTINKFDTESAFVNSKKTSESNLIDMEKVKQLIYAEFYENEDIMDIKNEISKLKATYSSLDNNRKLELSNSLENIMYEQEQKQKQKEE